MLKYNYRPEIIHARADYSAAVTLFPKLLFRSKVIWDCRGDSYAEFKLLFENKNKFIRNMIYLYLPNIISKISGLFVLFFGGSLAPSKTNRAGLCLCFWASC